jgi:hypothetical protein
MGDNFASYFVEDTTVCLKFYFPNSFRATEKTAARNRDETVLRERVISIYDTLAFVAQFLNLTHIANPSPSSQNISTFRFACVLKDAMKLPPYLTPGQDLARQY